MEGTAMTTRLIGLRDREPALAGDVAAGWLCFAASPTFAFMALLSGAGGTNDGLCTVPHEVWPLGDMATMYLLMSAFHFAPWFRLITARFSRRARF
jgi:hypothetical protein